MDAIRNICEGSIDFRGQKLAWIIIHVGLIGSAVSTFLMFELLNYQIIGFLVGFALRDVWVTTYIFLGGTFLSLLA
ncbi:Signal peptidase complex subunit 1 [Neolecta irregularis DAH-3]|uniref:Signal peptidase complex subunit 1 n=1 Tax=Neolecta irregularis (strain DAH-3) TaxID=1198029 RepID=A0A1U7LIJ0_NEOID|nr:Signal peptidase complex subunit 1 [Neolecta irregularis DAH-3]|eukprot:OLL22467.1 Signal peptidase complex subunit 1 [Neolecta irregularis DAH-3]